MSTTADELRWRKSTASGTGNCVEVAQPPGDTVFVRNSKQRQGPVVTFNQAEWQSFLIGVKRGEFDIPG